ncbi:16S rRNA (guanine(966)-N(2))-methyltransferase RsmD [bacterium]|nr:16S rRNA (guanine(966)-N(2))-methyltransferase RsmD [bacterium]
MIITAGIYKGRKILTPDEKITRPTLSKVRMGVFNTLYSIVGTFENKTFLDAFGGSGIMGLEALSRGFKSVTVYEKNKTVSEIIKKNYNSLGIKPNLHVGDSIKLVCREQTLYDVIYIDPPYYSGIYEKFLLGAKGKIIILEHSVEIDTPDYKLIKRKNYGDKIISFLTK